MKKKQTPTKLKDLTLGKYILFDELAKQHDESTDPNKDYILLEKWFGQDFTEMPADVADAFIDEWVKDMTDTTTINVAENEKPPKTIKIAGDTFEVPQNLEHDCTVAQYVDYSKYQQSYQGSSYGFYAVALAIFLKKRGQGYKEVKLNDRIELMKSVNLIDAVKITAFFFVQSQRYRDITNLFLARSQAEITKQTPRQN
jgi:hypothetical protein